IEQGAEIEIEQRQQHFGTTVQSVTKRRPRTIESESHVEMLRTLAREEERYFGLGAIVMSREVETRVYAQQNINRLAMRVTNHRAPMAKVLPPGLQGERHIPQPLLRAGLAVQVRRQLRRRRLQRCLALPRQHQQLRRTPRFTLLRFPGNSLFHDH